MKTFAILEPPSPADAFPDGGRPGLATEFVKDGFSGPAFLFGPLWLIWHRLWQPLVAVVAVLALVELVLWAVGAGEGTDPLPLLIADLAIGFEGSGWRLSQLERQGFREAAVLRAASLDECELRYFASRAPAKAEPGATPATGSAPA